MKQIIFSDGVQQMRPLAKRSLIAVFACVLFFCAAFCLSGCKPPAGQLAANAAIAEMAAIESCDPSSIDYLPEASQSKQLEAIGVSQEEFFSWWLEGYEYSLGDLELNIDEDDALINAKITCRKLEPVIQQWSNQYTAWLTENAQAIEAGQSEDPCAYGKSLLQGLFESTEPALTECTVHVHEYDDDWSIVGDAENSIYRDALLGSTDSFAGYYEAPLKELEKLGVSLSVPSAEDQSGQPDSEG